MYVHMHVLRAVSDGTQHAPKADWHAIRGLGKDRVQTCNPQTGLCAPNRGMPVLWL